jgi:hypothetical protein
VPEGGSSKPDGYLVPTAIKNLRLKFPPARKHLESKCAETWVVSAPRKDPENLQFPGIQYASDKTRACFGATLTRQRLHGSELANRRLC